MCRDKVAIQSQVQIFVSDLDSFKFFFFPLTHWFLLLSQFLLQSLSFYFYLLHFFGHTAL